MKLKPEDLLHTRRLPARISAEQAAVLIGCRTHDIPILSKAKLLKPLGKPSANSAKWFSSVDLVEKFEDVNWCSKVTDKLYEYWREQKKSD